MAEETRNPDTEELNELANKTIEYFQEDSWVVRTKCVIHDAQEVRRHKQLGLSNDPPKEKVKYALHLSDVEDLTQHFMQIEDEEDYEEVTIIQKFSGKTIPITTPFEEIYERYLKFHEQRDKYFEKRADELS